MTSKHMGGVPRWQLGLMLWLLVVGCRAHEQSATQASPPSSGTSTTPGAVVNTAAQGSDYVVPPEDYYRALMERALEAPTSAALVDDHVTKLYLDFVGGNVSLGFGKRQSFLLCKASVAFPGANLSAADVDAVVAMVQKHFDNASVAILVTADVPSADEDYTTIHVGGTYGSLGCPEDSNILGLAPLDDKNRNPNDVGFVFAARHNSLPSLAASIAHEAGHTFGLQHVTVAADIMFAYLSTVDQSFQSSPLKDSSGTQDGPTYLRTYVGTLSDSSTSVGTGTSTSTDTSTSADADCEKGVLCFFKRVVAGFQNMQNTLDSSTSFTNTGTPMSVFLDAIRIYFGEDGLFSDLVTFLDGYYGNVNLTAANGTKLKDALTVLAELYAPNTNGAMSGNLLDGNHSKAVMGLFHLDEALSAKDMEEQLADQRRFLLTQTSDGMQQFLLNLQKAAYQRSLQNTAYP